MRRPEPKFFVQLLLPLLLLLLLLLYYFWELCHVMVLKRVAAPLRTLLGGVLRWAHEAKPLALLDVDE